MKSLFIFLFPLTLFAHPVIYQGGVAVSSFNMEKLSNHYALYSFTPKFSAGAENWRFDKKDFGFLKANSLLYRKNTENSQGNLYLHTGYGTENTYQVGLEGDWETRRIYTSLKHLQFNHHRVSQGRIGFSPVEKSFNDLQVWVMFQTMVTRDETMLTPMLRFFYHNYLWEVGSSLKGEWMLNLMVHL